MNTTNDHTFLTPAEAASRANVSRPTINRALKSMDLAGHRDNRNRWRIAPDDLNAWASKRRPVHADQSVTSVQPVVMHSDSNQIDHLRSELASTREKLAAAAARAAAAEQDRDAWRSMAEKLAERPPGVRSWLVKRLRR